jgi:hypothetical protein
MTRYPLYRRLGCPRAGIAPTGILSPDRSSPWRVVIPTALSRPTEITYFSEILISTSKTERHYGQDDHILSIMVILGMEFLDHVMYGKKA